MAVDSALRSRPWDRLARLFTDIRPGELSTALLLGLYIFLIMAAYYGGLKPVREAFMSRNPHGAELASYASAIMALLLIPLLWGYTSLARRFPRRIFICVVLALFAASFAAYYALDQVGLPYLEISFFVWVGIFNVMVVAQFWSYGNDLYTPEQGGRLFPFIQLGQNLGAIVGPLLGRGLTASLAAPRTLLLLAAFILSLCMLLTWLVDWREEKKGVEEVRQPLGKEGAFRLVWSNRYLLYIALLILVLNIVNTTGEFLLRSSVFAAARESGLGEVFTTNFYLDFYFWVNLLTLLIQAFLVSRILKWMGVRGALFLAPVISTLGYFTIALLPILAAVRVIKTLENALDYSLTNTLRAALYLPTSREAKYKAKLAIDTFFVRSGDLLSAGFVYAGLNLLQMQTRGFALVLAGLALIWLVLTRAIAGEHRKLLPERGESGRM